MGAKTEHSADFKPRPDPKRPDFGFSANTGRANAVHPGAEAERGDVPGWVLVTLMTAGLVVAIWTIAGPALVDMFNNALQRVKNL